MLITANKVKERSKFSSYDLVEIERRLKQIEYAIHSYTHNDFLSKKIRFYANIENNIILANNSYIKANDTLLIKNEYIRNIFDVKKIAPNGIELNSDFEDEVDNLIIKIIYPVDVIEGALDVLEWDFKMRSKVGIKSETLSRHSLTYYDNDASNSVNGYPISLFGFLKPYRKART